MSILIPVGVTAANSVDITVAANTSIVLSLFDSDGRSVTFGATAWLQKKAANNTYTNFDQLTSNTPVLGFSNPSSGPLTIRVAKLEGPSFGVEVDA